jgi:hypothetical protein
MSCNYDPVIDPVVIDKNELLITKENINDYFQVDFVLTNTSSINNNSICLIYRSASNKLCFINTGIDYRYFIEIVRKHFPLSKQFYYKIKAYPDNSISIIASNNEKFRTFLAFEIDTELTLDYLNEKYKNS